MHALFRPVNLGAVTADLASLFRSAIKLSKIQYNVEVPDEEVEVWLDSDLWEKVVFNLIGNAFKYCLSGSIDIKIVKTKKHAVFSVTDTGCGIAESELTHIFDRFHRIESTSRSSEGTGIGLALTMEIVKLVGGTLEAQSVLGQGSTFTVTLPFGNAHLPPQHLSTKVEEEEHVEMAQRKTPNIAIVEEASRWASSNQISHSGSDPSDETSTEPSSASASDFESTSASGSNSGSGSDPTTASIGHIAPGDALSIHNSVILLADDNADMRKYCSSVLRKKFKVVEVADGQLALDYARQYSPDLVVSDIMMPMLGGYGLLTALREDPATQLIPVILLSARAGTEARVDGLQAGADDYLVSVANFFVVDRLRC